MAKTGDDKTAIKDGNGKHTGKDILSNKEPDFDELIPVRRGDLMNVSTILKSGRFDLSGDEAMELSNMRIRISHALAPKKVAARVPDPPEKPDKPVGRKRK